MIHWYSGITTVPIYHFFLYDFNVLCTIKIKVNSHNLSIDKKVLKDFLYKINVQSVYQV